MTDRQTVQPWTSTTASMQKTIWRTSSYSGTQGNCVQIAANLPGTIAVRDSKNPHGPVLTFHSDVWRAFLRRL